ncbi:MULTISPECIES: hypothetical protein [unclassified Pseudomonas]|uniref:hypothetical protein n=1 Tax=unclassified Pseudomonas TaxID=196821 RepID=UPI000F590919|nr:MULTISPECIES: hypothetical protein [unclassified Pseudomonas]MBO0491997.1 hypothetical protein [Pseudomonas sp. Marseille-Q1929]RQO52635.1 hypothetical protein DBR46_19630 [Pseudomonas sp. KBW05]
MTIFQRVVLLLKVLVLLTLGTTTAWANSAVQSQAPGFVAAKSLLLAKSESEAGDKDQGGSADDDDQQAPPEDDDSEGDSDT